MTRAFALVLVASIFAAPVYAEEDTAKAITYVRWVDMGPGRNVAQLKPANIAAMRVCKNWTMYFQPVGQGLEQSFVAGMMMSTEFPKVLVSHIAGETIFILTQKGANRPSDTLHLSQDGMVLTQISPPFRPHTYLRCTAN